jgi:hypothetical protein
VPETENEKRSSIKGRHEQGSSAIVVLVGEAIPLLGELGLEVVVSVDDQIDDIIAVAVDVGGVHGLVDVEDVGTAEVVTRVAVGDDALGNLFTAVLAVILALEDLEGPCQLFRTPNECWLLFGPMTYTIVLGGTARVRSILDKGWVSEQDDRDDCDRDG